MDGAFKTYTSLRCNLTQADLDFLIFGHRNKTRPGFAQFAFTAPPASTFPYIFLTLP